MKSLGVGLVALLGVLVTQPTFGQQAQGQPFKYLEGLIGNSQSAEGPQIFDSSEPTKQVGTLLDLGTDGATVGFHAVTDTSEYQFSVTVETDEVATKGTKVLFVVPLQGWDQTQGVGYPNADSARTNALEAVRIACEGYVWGNYQVTPKTLCVEAFNDYLLTYGICQEEPVLWSGEACDWDDLSCIYNSAGQNTYDKVHNTPFFTPVALSKNGEVFGLKESFTVYPHFFENILMEVDDTGGCHMHAGMGRMHSYYQYRKVYKYEHLGDLSSHFQPPFKLVFPGGGL